MNRPTIWAGPLLALALGIAAPARAQDADTAPDQRFALHGQTTVTAQGDAGFTAPYAGTNSLTPGQVRETIDVTLFGGMRLWKGAEIWVNGEMDQGFGLSDTLGVAGFTSGEAYKVGSRTPYVRLQRGFLRQTIALGGDALHIDAAANTLRQTTTSDRVVITVGKFGVGDVFDTNSYAHDPRADFLNWSVIDTGSFDYAADAWGYSLGAAAEWYQADWAVRFGLFNLSTEPNGTVLETSYAQNQMIVESEHRHKLGGRRRVPARGVGERALRNLRFHRHRPHRGPRRADQGRHLEPQGRPRGRGHCGQRHLQNARGVPQCRRAGRAGGGWPVAAPGAGMDHRGVL